MAEHSVFGRPAAAATDLVLTSFDLWSAPVDPAGTAPNCWVCTQDAELAADSFDLWAGPARPAGTAGGTCFCWQADEPADGSRG